MTFFVKSYKHKELWNVIHLLECGAMLKNYTNVKVVNNDELFSWKSSESAVYKLLLTTYKILKH